MMTKIIVKVQLPILTNDPCPHALIYSRGKKFIASLPVTPQLKEKMGSEIKQFFYWVDGKIAEKAPWQDW